MDEAVNVISELLNLPFNELFEYPRLFFVVVPALATVAAALFGRYLWNPGRSRWFSSWSPAFLRVWVIWLLIFSATTWFFYRYYHLPDAFAENEIGILIAEVPDQQNREQQTAYQNAIMDRIAHNETLAGSVRVRLIERPLPPDAEAQQLEALKIGRWLGAAFVLRPFIVGNVQEPMLTVVNWRNYFKPDSRCLCDRRPSTSSHDAEPNTCSSSTDASVDLKRTGNGPERRSLGHPGRISDPYDPRGSFGAASILSRHRRARACDISTPDGATGRSPLTLSMTAEFGYSAICALQLVV
jgi:hypothetical protein